MDNTYRFRFLFYLAAFVLILSICFAYAEPSPARALPGGRILGQESSPMEGPSFDPGALRVTTTPVVPNVLVLRMDGRTAAPVRGGRLRLFHRRPRAQEQIRILPPGLNTMVVLPSGVTIRTP
jgi:hypothetical protein